MNCYYGCTRPRSAVTWTVPSSSNSNVILSEKKLLEKLWQARIVIRFTTMDQVNDEEVQSEIER